MRKKAFSGFLALIIALMLAVPVVPAYAVPAADPLQDNEKIVDIYINADSNSGIDPDLIKTMLMEKLEGATKNFGGNLGILEDADIRINTNMVSLDISDLSAWYVYDHYGSNDGAVYDNDNQEGKITPPTSWTDVFGSPSVKRPYFAYWEQNTYYNPTVYRIEDYLQLPEEKQIYTAPLDQHIFALQDGSGDYAMTFVGYGIPGYGDFLYYPATSTGKKQVSFTVDSNYVNTHTMDSTYGGAGFLLNTGIDSSGYIHGYVLLYQFNSPTSLNALNLYKINNNVSADDFHQNGMFNNYSGGYVTQIASGTVPEWESMMDIDLEITPSNVTVAQKPSSDSEYVEVLNASLDDTAFNGFGPLVQYSSHWCDDSTQFRFTKLEMGFSTSSTSVLDALAKSNFLDDSEKYFVNLLNDDGGSTLNEGDWEGVARLRDGQIRYVTNVKNPFLNDGGIVSTGAPNGSNGKTILSYADLDELTDKLVAYILGNNTYKAPSGSITLSNPVAIFDLRAGDDESVATIVRDFLPTGGLEIYTNDSSIPSDGANLETYQYKITNPSGTSQTLPDRTSPASASNPLMTVDADTELGVWTVDLTVTDDAEKTSSVSTVTFLVAEAEEYDIVIAPGAHMTLSGGSTSQTVVQFMDMEEITVTADEGFAVPGTYYIGDGLVFEKTSDTTGVVTGSPTADQNVTLKNCRMASVVTCELGKGDATTPETEKYYVTITPTDPDFEYTVITEDFDLDDMDQGQTYSAPGLEQLATEEPSVAYPVNQTWVSGTGGSLVFGPFDDPNTYYVLVRPLESDDIPDLMDTFVLQGVEVPVIEPGTEPEKEAVDTGDDSNPLFWGLAALLALAGMGVAVYRRRITD
jgi:hypothetical protein